MNKIERVKAVLENKKPDRTPAGFWFHYSGEDSKEKMVANHLKLYHETDMDIIKIMQDYPYPIIGNVTVPSDWKSIRFDSVKSKEFKKLNYVLESICDAVGGEAMVFQTLFGPFKAAVMAFGNDLVMTHAKEAPEELAEGIHIIAQEMQNWTQSYLDTGASGIYYAAQFGEKGRFTKEEWANLVRPSDLMILELVKKQTGKYNMLHICGEPEYNFLTNIDWFKDYPADIVNWSVKDTGISLSEGSRIFGKPVLGGMNNKGNILNNERKEIQKEVNETINSFGQKGFMIGADCTIQGENISIGNIKNAVDAAHAYNA